MNNTLQNFAKRAGIGVIGEMGWCRQLCEDINILSSPFWVDKDVNIIHISKLPAMLDDRNNNIDNDNKNKIIWK